MLQWLLDFLFPRSRDVLTKADYPRLQVAASCVVEDTVVLRRHSIKHLDKLTAYGSYKESCICQAISQFKYKRHIWLAPMLAQLFTQACVPQAPTDAVLCPVPLHWMRRASRGFNQAELLAVQLSEYLPIPVVELLKRTRNTGHQAWRNRHDRLRAVQGAFALCHHQHMPSHVVLIDDVITTGATLDECARVLKEGGVEYVESWVIARD